MKKKTYIILAATLLAASLAACSNASYYHHSDLHEVDADENGFVKDDSALTALNNEYFDAKVIEFTVVK